MEQMIDSIFKPFVFHKLCLSTYIRFPFPAHILTSSLLTFNSLYRMNVRSLITFTDLSLTRSRSFVKHWNQQTPTSDRDRRHILIRSKFFLLNPIKPFFFSFVFFFVHMFDIFISRCFSIIICRNGINFNGACWAWERGKKRKRS